MLHGKKKRRILICCLAVLTVLGAATALAFFSEPIWPEAGGVDVAEDDGLVVDYSNDNLGYLMVHGPETDKGLKLQVAGGGGQLLYDINSRGEFEIIPLQFGSGKYSLQLFKNAKGNKYAAAGSVTIKAELDNEDAAFLVPNQYVPYDENSAGVALSHEMLDNLGSDKEKFEAVRAYMTANFTYDFNKAKTVTNGTMPSIEYLLENKMGICQDLSALAACMFRVQGIPTRFIIGYLDGKYYHAWVGVLLDGEWVRYDPTAELGGIPSGMKYSIERYY